MMVDIGRKFYPILGSDLEVKVTYLEFSYKSQNVCI